MPYSSRIRQETHNVCIYILKKRHPYITGGRIATLAHYLHVFTIQLLVQTKMSRKKRQRGHLKCISVIENWFCRRIRLGRYSIEYVRLKTGRASRDLPS